MGFSPDYVHTKLVAYCSKCAKISAMAVADTVDELYEAARAAKQWKKQGREIQILHHSSGDKLPDWCECGVGSDE